jgi:recombinase
LQHSLNARAGQAAGGLASMQTERIRQTVSGPITLEDLEKFQKQGWTAIAIEWQREVPSSEAAPRVEGPPYGLRVGDNCLSLEEDPDEAKILVTMMELMIQDGPYSSIAQELNRRGYATREGSKWNPVSVFKMLPRLIEAGPKIFSSVEWQRRRQQVRERKQGLPI